MNRKRRYRELIHEAARFCVVGGLGVVVTGGGTNLLRETAGLGWLTATVLATVAGIAVTYLGSRYWTFRHRARTSVPRETALFFALAGLGLLIQVGCLDLVVHGFGDTGRLAGNVGLAAGIVLATVFRFWAYRTWVWRAPGRGRGRPDRKNYRDTFREQGMPDQRSGEPDRAGGREPVRA
jgi:putative flippase GtrA